MPKVLSSFGNSRSVSETETVTPREEEGDDATGSFIDAAGDSIYEYATTGAGDSPSNTFVKTGLGRVNGAQITVACKPSGVTEVVARPATEDDFGGADDYVPGTIYIELHGPDGTEVADGDDLTGFELTYTATRT